MGVGRGGLAARGGGVDGFGGGSPRGAVIATAHNGEGPTVGVGDGACGWEAKKRVWYRWGRDFGEAVALAGIHGGDVECGLEIVGESSGHGVGMLGAEASDAHYSVGGRLLGNRRERGDA